MENGSRPPRKWVPDHADRAIIACLRDGTVAMELIDWDSPEDPAEFCEVDHTIRIRPARRIPQISSACAESIIG